MTNKEYLTLMKRVCTANKKLGAKAFTFMVISAGPDPVAYLQHVLNKMKNFTGYFMVAQCYDHTFSHTADNLLKQPQCAFLILKSFRAQNEEDHQEVLEECEKIAEGCIAWLHKYFKKPVANKIADSMDLNEVSVEAISLFADNKAGARAEFRLKKAHGQMLVLSNADWTELP